MFGHLQIFRVRGKLRRHVLQLVVTALILDAVVVATVSIVDGVVVIVIIICEH